MLSTVYCPQPRHQHFNVLNSFQPLHLLEIPDFGNSPYSCGSAAGTVSASPKIVDVAAGWPAGPKYSEEEELTEFDSVACDEAACGQLLCQVRLSPLLLKETVDEEEPLLQNRDISLQCAEQQTNSSNRILIGEKALGEKRGVFCRTLHQHWCSGMCTTCLTALGSSAAAKECDEVIIFSVITEFFQANRLKQNHETEKTKMLSFLLPPFHFSQRLGCILSVLPHLVQCEYKCN